jgi:cell surface protein SprA
MMDVNGGLTQNMPFITDALAAIPFLKARDASSFTIHGEGAMDIPDPNTRGSNIPSDNGQSVAYIDDFEGANRTIPLNVLFSGWTLGSVPLYTPLRSYSSDSVLTNVEKTYSKARLLWYNNSATYRPVNSTTVWPNRQVLAQDQFISTLILDYDPNHRGMYNYSPNLDSSLHRASFGVGTGTGMFDTADARRRNWNGIMRYVGTIAGDLLAQNINYLQIWVNTSAANVQDLRRGRLYVDLGAISEDAIPNGVLNSEDIIKTPSNPLGLPTGRVQDGADLGLDMISDAQELQQYDSSFIEPNKKKGKLDPDIDLTDPSGDDYRYTTGDSDFTHYNGTEGNYTGGSPAGRFPDTEDLNGDGTMEPNNAYLEYEVPLDSFYYNDTNMTDLTKYKNPYLIGGNAAASWYEFQIPLKEPARIVTDGETETNETILQNVQYARLWVSGFADPVKFTIAEMDLVGNQWIQPPTQTDSVLSISVENIEDNPGYQSPPGVQRPIDRTDPSQVIQGNEQSLSLVLNKLPQGQEREADKLSTASPLNLFNYAQMKMFVHADPSFQYYDKNHYDAEVFLRFGLDQNNFYECRMPITQTSTGWFEMAVDFSKLTVVKSTRDADTSVHADSLYHLVGTTFGIKGSPALNNIAYIAVGVTNPAAPKGKPFLTGSVWVDELRLVDANNAKGYAYHFDSNLKLSDLGSVGFNYSMTDPNFHGLTDRFGTQIDQTNWAINSNVSFDKYFPMNMQGSTLSFGYSHGESLTDPKYLPGSDVLVDAAAAQANLDHRQSPGNSTTPGDSVKLSSQTLHTQDSYVIPTFRLVLPTKFWLVDETFNKISYTFNYNTTDDRNPTILSSKAWNWNFASQYAVTMPGDLSIQPFKSLFKNVFLLDAYSEWKIYFVPLTNLNASVNATRAASDQVSRDLSAPISYQRSFTSSKSLSFGWHATEGGLLNVSGDYGISTTRDLLGFDTSQTHKDISTLFQDIFFKGTDGQFSQRINIVTKPKIPNIFSIPKYFDLNGGYNVSYNYSNNFQEGDLGKTAGWTNNINLTSTLRLKSLTDPWFQSTPSQSSAQNQAPPPVQQVNDTTKNGSKDSTGQNPSKGSLNFLGPLKNAADYLIKIPFLNYESIGIQFQQSNSVSDPGVLGSTGFENFWRPPFLPSDTAYGPSRLYQLGLISDPTGSLVHHGGDPFFGWEVIPGKRAANAVLSDQFNQSNSIGLHTSRPLWDGASLDIIWNLKWSFTKTTTILTDSTGYPRSDTAGVVTTTAGNTDKTIFSFPLFGLFGSLKKVGELYGPYYAANPNDPNLGAELATSFQNGLEGLKYLPINYTFRWDGLQKIGFLSSIFKSLTLDHGYTSTFHQDWVNTTGIQQTNAERIQYGFSPLIGLTGTPKDFLGGNMSGSFKYNTTTAYDLSLSSANITETYTEDISISLNYGKHGFSLPLFGINLQNDVDFTLSFSLSKNTQTLFDPTILSTNQDGTPLGGTTTTTLEPRIRYGLSSRVTASVFFQYTNTSPAVSGATIFATTTTEAGVDISISIQP